MKKVYIAGPYSGTNVLEILDNIRTGMRISTQVFTLGFAPFCPWHDFLYHLMLQPDENLLIDDYYDYSIAWLEVSDCMLVIPGWENSKGTLNEMDFAENNNIPIYFDIETLKLCETI